MFYDAFTVISFCSSSLLLFDNFFRSTSWCMAKIKPKTLCSVEHEPNESLVWLSEIFVARKLPCFWP